MTTKEKNQSQVALKKVSETRSESQSPSPDTTQGIFQCKDMDAKKEEMLLFQVMEEHINKRNNKDVGTCANCIRLALNKGANAERQHIKAKVKKILSEITEQGAEDSQVIIIGLIKKRLGLK